MNYFDYTATTPVDSDVLDTYIKVTKQFFANSSSLHKLGEESNHMYEECVKSIKSTIGVVNHNIIFTSNATEANNLGILGVCEKYNTGKIITTKIEHASVYNVCQELEKKYDVVYLDVDENGIINLDQFEKELDENTILVSIMWVNNIVGTIQPIDKIINIIKSSHYGKTRLHVDCVQGLCKVKPNFNFNDIDLFTFSLHKLYGPKGLGGLFVKNNIELKKRLYGSNAQYGVKPGTFDVALIAACAKAFKKFYPLTEEHLIDVKEKFDYLYNSIKDNKHIVFNTPKENISYYIMNISIPKIKGETIVHILEQEEIYVSTGSACSSKLQAPEKTILAITNNVDLSTHLIRISLSFLTNYREIDILIKALNKITRE